jgi:hypothetical protein
MELNPYQSPEPPEEPVAFREIGHTWPGWKTISRVGGVSASLSVLAAVIVGAIGFKPNWYFSVAFMVCFFGGLFLIYAGRLSAFAHSIVLMFRGEYD